MTEELFRLAQQVGADWKSSPYYAASEKYVNGFWAESSRFKQLFNQMVLGVVIDLACGHGKQSQFIVDQCEKLYLVDINRENLDACKERFAGCANIEYVLTRGFDLPMIDTQSVDSIFCYDSMVHFPQEVVAAYISETKRVLKKGGRGLFHHSNLAEPPSASYGRNPHARNRMSREMFCAMAEQAGLTVLKTETFAWANVADLDCMTFVES
jgi:ubiquinone/menaquinone biosynthesis C-methylase UbiE